MNQRNPRIKNSAHLKFIAKLSCCCCGDDSAMRDRDAAHIRMSDAEIGKVNAGVGQKPHDRYTVPLCRVCHNKQHEIGDERKFWIGSDPIKLALELYANSGNAEECERIIWAFQDDRMPSILAAG